MSNRDNKNLFSGLWGFAEATLFFILPDVLLSYFALNKKEPLWKYCLWALSGALIGGALLYWLGAFYQTVWWQLIELVPAINTDLMNKVASWMRQDGLTAILLGPSQGLPYKTFAVQAFDNGVGFWQFMLISIPARLIRFLLFAYVARLLSMTLMKNFSRRTLLVIWMTIWVISYFTYFSMFPS